MIPNPELCVKCKGRLWCGLDHCPILTKKNALSRVKSKLKDIKEDFSTKTNSVFVGRIGYPRINLGLLTPVEDPNKPYDNPKEWSEKGRSIQEIIDFRTALINSRRKQKQIIVGNDYKIRKIQEITLSEKPVSVEVMLKDKPKINLNFSTFTPPFGPNAKLKKIREEENPKIKSKVDKYYDDYDTKATTAIFELYKKGIDEAFLTKAISVGSFGLKTNRKLVPTRWSITAVDDAIGKQLIEKIKDYGSSENTAYFGGHLGNYYIILLFSGEWSYELFEMYMPKTDWNTGEKLQYTTDYENYYGRKSYAENCAGGYYAARLGILEELARIKKQASVLALRIITPEYYAPLGVWVVREAVRKAMKNKPLAFANDELMIKYAQAVLKKKYGITEEQFKEILIKSKLLAKRKNQKRITDY